jgi:hypothetical protein
MFIQQVDAVNRIQPAIFHYLQFDNLEFAAKAKLQPSNTPRLHWSLPTGPASTN